MSSRKIWPVLVLTNFAAFVGIVSSIFVLPGNIRFWLWATNSLMILALINYFTVTTLKKRDSRDRTPQSKTVTAITLGGFLLFILDLLYGFMHR